MDKNTDTIKTLTSIMLHIRGDKRLDANFKRSASTVISKNRQIYTNLNQALGCYHFFHLCKSSLENKSLVIALARFKAKCYATDFRCSNGSTNVDNFIKGASALFPGCLVQREL